MDELGAAGFETFTSLGYFSIVAALQCLRVSKRDTPPPLKRLFFLVEIFLVECGLIHLLDPFTCVYHIAVAQQMLKVITLLFAIFTSTTIFQLIPFFVALPSACQLQAVNTELKEHKENLHKLVAQRTQELKQEKARWQIVAEQSPQILWLKNRQGKIEYYNQRWYQYTGMSLGEEGACARVIHPVDLELMHTKWLQGCVSAEVSDYKIRIKRAADNTYRWHLVRCVPLRDVETNEILQYCGIATDIHDTEMVRELSMADATRKARFLAMISHEMRTPLTGIIGMATLLGDTVLQDHQVEILNNVKLSADKLLSLVNNILDLFKLHNDKFVLEMTTFELNDCVREVLSAVSEEAANKRIIIHDEINRAILPSLIQADRGRLRQVLLNLLSNAVKFTPEWGHIYISASHDRTDTKGIIKFSVRDTGIGIQEQDMVKVFETFSQVDTSSTRKFGGTGIGLAISKGLVELMRGSIWCESEPGKGTTFYFTFEADDVTHEGVARSDDSKAPMASKPLLYASSCDDIVDSDGAIISSIETDAAVEHENHSDSEAEEGVVCIVKPKILVVDDTEMNQKVLKRILGSIGYNDVDIVSDGAQAVDAVANNTYDIVFMDMEMPVMDGVTATKHIRALSREFVAKQPHIIAVTANAFTEDVERCLTAGMCVHMAKPLKRDDLRKKMDRAIQVLAGNDSCTCRLPSSHPHGHHHHHHQHAHHTRVHQRHHQGSQSPRHR